MFKKIIIIDVIILITTLTIGFMVYKHYNNLPRMITYTFKNSSLPLNWMVVKFIRPLIISMEIFAFNIKPKFLTLTKIIGR